jgi:hypothetical protein
MKALPGWFGLVILITCGLLLCVAVEIVAHDAPTDKYGCHKGPKGDYHCHVR